VASAETVVLTLQEQISGPAEAAAGGLSKLEQQILREQATLAMLETKLGNARQKMDILAAGTVEPKAIAAYEKQAAAVEDLNARLDLARAKFAELANAPEPDESAITSASSQVNTLGMAASAATEKLAAMGSPDLGVVNVAQLQSASGQVDYFGIKCEEQVAKIEELKGQLSGLGDAASAPAAEVEKLGDAMGAAAGPAGVSSEALGDLGEASQRLAGPMGEKIGKLRQFGEALAELGPEAIAAAVAVAAAVAAIAAIGAVFVAGVKSAGEYRDELLRLQGAVGGNAEAAKELQGAITQVASGSALARDKITDLAGQLARAGLQGAELRNALEAAAIASSAGGDQMANDFIKAAEAAKKTGGSVDELSKAMKDKLGGVAAAQALSFGVQIDKLKENLVGLFSGADITPLLEAMHALLSIFDATTAEGQAMRETIGGAIEFIIGALLRLGTILLYAYVAIKSNAVAWAVVKLAAMGVVAALVFVAAVVGVIIAIMGAAWGVITMVWGAIAYIGMAVVNGLSTVGSFLYEYLIQPFVDAYDALSSFSLAEIGSNMINGLIGGIKGAAGAFVSSIVGVVKSGVQAAKSALGIASPSKVFADIGLNTGAGMVRGVDASAEDVQASTEGLADAAVTGATAGKKAAGALGAKGGASTGFAPTFSNCNFVGTTQREVEAMMRAVFEAEYLDAGAVA